MPRKSDLKPPVWSVEDWEALVSWLAAGVHAGVIDSVEVVGLGKVAVRLWAERRAADLLGMSWDGEAWVPNPRSKYVVSDTVRDRVHRLVVSAVDEGWDVGRLHEALFDAFSDINGRALMIASTETAMAYNEGTLANYAAMGVKRVEVVDGPGCIPDGHDDEAPLPDLDIEGVQEDRQAHGQIWTVAEAMRHPLGHPNCVRQLLPVLET